MCKNQKKCFEIYFSDGCCYILLFNLNNFQRMFSIFFKNNYLPKKYYKIWGYLGGPEIFFEGGEDESILILFLFIYLGGGDALLQAAYLMPQNAQYQVCTLRPLSQYYSYLSKLIISFYLVHYNLNVSRPLFWLVLPLPKCNARVLADVIQYGELHCLCNSPYCMTPATRTYRLYSVGHKE